MTRIAAIVPMRHNSERVPGKNYRMLGGRPLYHHIIETLIALDEVHDVVIDTDSDLIASDAKATFPEVKVLMRPDHLVNGEIPMNDVLLNTVSQLDADLILQTHSTNPFLSKAVLSTAIHRFLDQVSDGADSVFSVTRMHARFWTETGTPLNHDPAVLLRTQDLSPVFLENSCFYIFTPELLQQTGSRIGNSPMMIEVPLHEALDIDEEADFQLAIAVAHLKGSL